MLLKCLMNLSDEKQSSVLPTRSTATQPTGSAQTSSIPVPGRTARTSSAVNRPASSLKSAGADVSTPSPTGSGSSTELNANRSKTSRPSGLPCPPGRGQATAVSRVLPSVGTTPRGNLPPRAYTAEHVTSNSLPSSKSRALSANASTSGLVPPGSGSKVIRAPSRSLSRTQGGIKSGRRSAEPSRTRAGLDEVVDTTRTSSSGTDVTTGVMDHTQTQSSTRSTDSIPPPASVRRTTSKLIAPRASSASKIQQTRKPIPTSVPTVASRPPMSVAINSTKTSAGVSTGIPSVTSSDRHVTAKSSVAVVRQLSVDSGSSSTLDAAAGSQADVAENSRGGGHVAVESQQSNQLSNMPGCSSVRQASTNEHSVTNRIEQSAPSIDVAPCSDVTELPVTSSPDVVDSALSVSPMQPMTSRAYMTSSGNPIMTSRLLSASQRPFTPLSGTWGGRLTLTNGYASDGDTSSLVGTHSGYLSEGGTRRRTGNLPALDAMQQYLENVDDDDEDR